VDTFPFLAVLLCAMGSLILLLLVIDRRARVVARAKALAAAELALSQENDAGRALKEEWETRRRALHEEVVAKNMALLHQTKAVRAKIATTVDRIRSQEDQIRTLSGEIEARKATLERRNAELNQRRQAAGKTAEQNQASQAELVELTGELVRLEQTLAELKEFQKRQQQMYSLVPYQGKRGDNRRPVYIECSAGELIFHPNRTTLTAFSADAIRREILTRISRDPIVQSAAQDKPESRIYVLFLVRPKGIASYYRALAALNGMNLQFGYEFVDQDWSLDFSENGDRDSKQPLLQANSPLNLPRDAAAAKKVAGLQPTVPGGSWGPAKTAGSPAIRESEPSGASSPIVGLRSTISSGSGAPRGAGSALAFEGSRPNGASSEIKATTGEPMIIRMPVTVPGIQAGTNPDREKGLRWP
jgi:hypothetical protein